MPLLKLRDFFHLPQIDSHIQQLTDGGPGLCLVAGPDLHLVSEVSSQRGFLPSGRPTVFWILLQEILETHPAEKCTVITESKESVRFPRSLKRRLTVLETRPSEERRGRMVAESTERSGLLVVERLNEETMDLALSAASQGRWVISQIDTIFRGAGVARQLLDLGISPERLTCLSWVLTVQRLPALCPSCKQLLPLDADQLAVLRSQYPPYAHLFGVGATFFRAKGCPDCRQTGRKGDVAVFDIFHPSGKPVSPSRQPGLLQQSSLFSMEAYVLHLASLGYLPLDDFLFFESDQLRRTFNLLEDHERELLQSNTSLEARLLQLEAANRVLQRQTNALISLQDIGQALVTGTDLADLARLVCRRTCELCGADRAILYYQRSAQHAEVLATIGWDLSGIQRLFEASQVFSQDVFQEPTPFTGYPPGVVMYKTNETLRAGLYIPLIVQNRRVGLLIVQSTEKVRFAPGELAMLQTFSQQAALALQRAGLIEQLRSKIEQLEAAQVELAQKERLEREMELARQVQQSVLPTDFPSVTGFRFAAQNEPARRVGGDFYDVFSLDEDHFGLAIADVSDKGMPAALYMALTRSLLRSEARREPSPAVVVANVNRLLIELAPGVNYVTLFYGVVDRLTRSFTYTRAGHDRPFLLRGEIAIELGGMGTSVGLLEEGEFSVVEEQISLASGDQLVLYTDGLCDILNSDEIPFGRDRLKDLLVSYSHLPADQLCHQVFKDLFAYRGDSDQYDDMTLVVVNVE